LLVCFSAKRDYYPVDGLLELTKVHPRACGNVPILWNGLVTNPLRFLLELDAEYGPVVFGGRTLVIEIENIDSRFE